MSYANYKFSMNFLESELKQAIHLAQPCLHGRHARDPEQVHLWRMRQHMAWVLFNTWATFKDPLLMDDINNLRKSVIRSITPGASTSGVTFGKRRIEVPWREMILTPEIHRDPSLVGCTVTAVECVKQLQRLHKKQLSLLKELR